MAELVTFDLDGTLIDSMQDIACAVNHARKTFGFEPLPLPVVTAMTGGGARNLMTLAFEGTSVSVDDALACQKEFYTANPVVHTVLYPGVKEGLAAMKEKGLHLALITNKQTAVAEKILDIFGIGQYFEEVWGGNSGFPLKPDPAALLAFQKQCGVPAEKCWMLGDHYTDLGAGRQAGFVRALARWGFGDPQDEAFDREFFTFAEFTAAVIE